MPPDYTTDMHNVPLLTHVIGWIVKLIDTH